MPADLLTPTVFDSDDLKRGVCHWPIGDPKDPAFGYCGRRCATGSKSSYCPEHGGTAYAEERRTAPTSMLKMRINTR